jgi:hypothetical protein
LLHAALNRARFRWRALAGAAGIVSLAAGAGVVLAVLAAPAAGSKQGALRAAGGRPTIDAVHLPPVLRVPGERAAVRYDIYCAPPDDAPEAGCRGAGTVYARAGTAGPFQALPLTVDAQAVEGRYVADLPPAIASSPSGFTYYAVLRDETSGATVTLPAGGADAPQRSLSISDATVVDLGTHRFGLTRAADATVAAAAWGNGARDAGLEEGRVQSPIGASSFDIAPDGAVDLLDEANGRVLRFAQGQVSSLPLQIDGTIGDLAVGADGSLYVLESTGEGGPTPTLRRFDAAGRPLGSWPTAERTTAAVRIGPDGPVTLSYPSSEWMPAADGADALDRAAQARGGSVARPLADGSGGVAVYRLRDGHELRLAVVGSDGVAHAWRILSATAIGELQLAQPVGNRLVAVFATYTDEQSEFEVLVLDPAGVVQQFAVPAAEWAESAPLARFRLFGSSLYQLGSTPTGVYVDRYDLGVN